MFERFFNNAQKPEKSELASETFEDLTDQELADMIDRVQAQVLDAEVKPELQINSGPTNEDNKHPVKTVDDVEKEMKTAANPHGFTELK